MIYGDIIGYLLIGTDNSMRKQVELELNKAMAVAKKANLAKSASGRAAKKEYA
jgi:hypothetical protein